MMGLDLSDDVRLLRSPFSHYGAMREAPPADLRRSAAVRALRVMVTLGLFVSLTTTGRVVPEHLAGAMVSWSFAPVVQSVAALVAARIFSRETPRARVLDLYFAGHGPWLAVMWLGAGVVVLAPSPSAAFYFLLSKGILPAVLLSALAAGGVLNVAMFRRGLGLSRGRTAGATVVFYLLFVGQIVAYYLLNDSIQPQLGVR
jgi:hypothetical protein